MKKYQKNWLPVNIGHRQERRIKSLAKKSGESWVNTLGDLTLLDYINAQRQDGMIDFSCRSEAGKIILPRGHIVQVQTFKRKFDPLSDDVHVISEPQIKEDTDIIAFLTYNYIAKVVWLHGVTTKKQFLNHPAYDNESARYHLDFGTLFPIGILTSLCATQPES